MSKADNTADKAAQAWRNQRRTLRLECRECEVICERVVSPWHCLRADCSGVYAYEDGETTYFGCLHKVFEPELDLAAFSGACEASKQGSGLSPRRRLRHSDPYGSLRAFRSPLSQCRVTVERVYAPSSPYSGCCNPTFFHHPATSEDDGIRMISRLLPDRGPESPE
jgi:hypothetical protein